MRVLGEAKKYLDDKYKNVQGHSASLEAPLDIKMIEVRSVADLDALKQVKTVVGEDLAQLTKATLVKEWSGTQASMRKILKVAMETGPGEVFDADLSGATQLPPVFALLKIVRGEAGADAVSKSICEAKAGIRADMVRLIKAP